MMQTKKFFGTDGIRGRVGSHKISADFILKLGWAFGRVVSHYDRNPRVLIGKDTRLSGYMLESSLEAGLSAAGVDICLLGPMPTPAIAYLTRTLRATGGIVISASHNPSHDNGIKFFTSAGIKISDPLELAIEKTLEQPMITVQPNKLGRAERLSDAPGRYIEFCKSTFPSKFDLRGMTLVVDCAHGATYHIAPNVFHELGAEVITIGNHPDGLNINKNYGATCPQKLAEVVLAEGADLGIALDGDGDRLIMVDESGTLIDGDEILFIIAKHLHQYNLLQGGVVGTLMSNYGLEVALQQLGVDFCRTQVGDRHISAALLQRGWNLGGESSGHIICHDFSTTGDGVIAALQVLSVMQSSNLPLSQLIAPMVKYPQCLMNVPITQTFNFAEHTTLQYCLRQIEHDLQGDGRVVLRSSGTEPVIRVMVEGQDAQLVQKYATQLATAVKSAQEEEVT